MNKTLLFVLLKKTTRIKKNQFHNICYLTWRTRGLINPILLSKTTFRFFANNNIFSSLKKKSKKKNNEYNRIIFLNKLNLANISKKKYFLTPYTKLTNSILIILIKLGYIHSFQLLNNKTFVVILKYLKNKHAIRGIKILSTSTRSFTINKKFIKTYNKYNRLNNTNGFYICTTNKGLMTDIEIKLLKYRRQIII